MMRKVAAEVVGTFALVFAGTGAIVVNDLYGGAVTHVGRGPDVRPGRPGHDLRRGGRVRGAT